MLARPAPGLRALRAPAAPAWQRRQRRAGVRACACASPTSSDVSVEEMLTYEFGVVNRNKRKELLRHRAVAASQSAAALRSQLVMLRTLLAVTDEDFSCILCACDVGETCGLLELGPSKVAARLAQVCVALPPGSNAGKVVGAAPSLLLYDEPGERVRRALEVVEQLGAQPQELVTQRPGSFGEVLAELCRGNYELTPFLQAWLLGSRK